MINAGMEWNHVKQRVRRALNPGVLTTGSIPIFALQIPEGTIKSPPCVFIINAQANAISWLVLPLKHFKNGLMMHIPGPPFLARHFRGKR